MEDKLISIIIPVYNSSKSIRHCLESCMSQTYKNIEIICVDDGSKDNTALIIKQISSFDLRVRYFYKPNKGLVSSRKYGLDYANGEFVFFLDSDDYINNKSIEQLNNYSRKYNYIVGAMILEKENGQRIKKRNICNKTFSQRDNIITAFLTGEIVPSLCGRLIKKDLFNDYKLISNDLTIGEDMITNIFIATFNRLDIIVLNIDIYHYVQYPYSMLNNKNLDKTVFFFKEIGEQLKDYINKSQENRLCSLNFMSEQIYGLIRDGGYKFRYSIVNNILESINYTELNLSLYKKIIIFLYKKKSILLPFIIDLINLLRYYKNY